jgi:hypothetical protein
VPLCFLARYHSARTTEAGGTLVDEASAAVARAANEQSADLTCVASRHHNRSPAHPIFSPR